MKTSSSQESTSLSIGMDLTFLGRRACGLGRYVCELIPALLEVEPDIRITAVVGLDAPPELMAAPWSDSVRFVRLPLRPSGTWQHRLSQRVVQPLLAVLHRVDVFHNPATLGPVRIPGRPTVATLLDLIWLRYPQTQWASERVAGKMADAVMQCARRADRILSYSEAAAEDLARALVVPRDRIDQAPLGVRVPETREATPEQVLRADLGLTSKKLILCVAQKQPHKNLGALLRALEELDDPNVALVLPGEHTPHEGELRALATQLGLSNQVRFPDWLPEEDLEGLYRMASLVALPSLIEGFGLPVLEAMARGIPVACSNRWALPEVAGDAALLFDPESDADLVSALRGILYEPGVATELAKRGKARADKFTWSRTAQETLACYRRAMANYRKQNQQP